MSGLDHPVWASLQHQPHWALGDERARRFLLQRLQFLLLRLHLRTQVCQLLFRSTDRSYRSLECHYF